LATAIFSFGMGVLAQAANPSVRATQTIAPLGNFDD
jgi:hypothetical protein